MGQLYWPRAGYTSTNKGIALLSGINIFFCFCGNLKDKGYCVLVKERRDFCVFCSSGGGNPSPCRLSYCTNIMNGFYPWGSGCNVCQIVQSYYFLKHVQQQQYFFHSESAWFSLVYRSSGKHKISGIMTDKSSTCFPKMSLRHPLVSGGQSYRYKVTPLRN